jgi:hypothetical protein
MTPHWPQSLRRATSADHRWVYGCDPVPGWIGFIVEVGSKPLALLIATTRHERDDEGRPVQRTWAFLWSRGEAISPGLLHLAAKRLIAMLAGAGARCLYAFSDAFRADGDMWLRRLGFAVDLSLAGPNQYPVWRCDLA